MLAFLLFGVAARRRNETMLRRVFWFAAPVVAWSAAAFAWRAEPVAALALAIAVCGEFFTVAEATAERSRLAGSMLLAGSVAVLLQGQPLVEWGPGLVWAAVLVGAGWWRSRKSTSPPWIAGCVSLGAVALLLLVPGIVHGLLESAGTHSNARLAATIAEQQTVEFSEWVALLGPWVWVASIGGVVWLAFEAVRRRRVEWSLLSWPVIAAAFSGHADVGRMAFIGAVVPLAAVGAAWAPRVFLHLFDRAANRNRLGWGSGAVGALVAVGLLVAGPTLAAGISASQPWPTYDPQNPPSYAAQRYRYSAYHADPALLIECATVALYRCDRTVTTSPVGYQYESWTKTFDALASRDTQLPPKDRPAVIAWWDYGTWIQSLGKHPAVADGESESWQVASQFLSASSESDAQIWLLQLLLAGDRSGHAGHLSADVAAIMAKSQPAWSTHAWDEASVDDHRLLAASLPGLAVFSLYESVAKATGRSVGYLAVENRMFPYDDPRTQGIDSRSIMYAPLWLAGKNPDDYMQWQYHVSYGYQEFDLTVHQYSTGPDGVSSQLDALDLVDAQGAHWVIVAGNLYPVGEAPGDAGGAVKPIPMAYAEESMLVSPLFSQTMFGRAFGSLDGREPAGARLNHWRVISDDVQNNVRAGVLLEYVPSTQI